MLLSHNTSKKVVQILSKKNTILSPWTKTKLTHARCFCKSCTHTADTICNIPDKEDTKALTVDKHQVDVCTWLF
jgi:hypothetical protein